MPFCPNCGTQYTEGAQFCPNCGKPFVVSSATGPGATFGDGMRAPSLASIQRPTGVTILAVLQMIGSLITIGVGVVIPILGVAIIAIGVLTLIFAVALLSGRNWARILVMIGAVLDILTIVGIIWGVILLWYFTRRHVVAYFKSPK